MGRNTTLKEIAEITGFSVSTISKALRDSNEISIQSKEKIKSIAKLLGFQPNKLAVSLRSGKNYCIAVILPSIEDPFYARIFHGIQTEVANTNYSLITCISNEKLQNEKYLIDKIYNQVDAFIISPSAETIIKKELNHFKSLQESSKPLIIIDRTVNDLSCCQIHNDGEKDIAELTKKIFADGYKNVAFVSSTNNVNNHFKKEGFISVDISIYGNLAKKYILESNAKDLKKELINLVKINKIDCIICASEDTTFKVIKILKLAGINVPKDIALIGYMSEYIADNLEITITTINQHRKTIGSKAIKLLLERLENPMDTDKKALIKIESTLVKRESYTR